MVCVRSEVCMTDYRAGQKGGRSADLKGSCSRTRLWSQRGNEKVATGKEKMRGGELIAQLNKKGHGGEECGGDKVQKELRFSTCVAFLPSWDTNV